MHQIYPDVGLIPILELWASNDLHFWLFSNNATIDRAITLAGLTAAAFVAVNPITVAAADFTLSGIANHKATILAAPIAFVNTSGGVQSAYGYYVTDTGDAVLYAAARFDSAPVAKLDGESWNVTPVLGDFSEFAT